MIWSREEGASSLAASVAGSLTGAALGTSFWLGAAGPSLVLALIAIPIALLAAAGSLRREVVLLSLVCALAAAAVIAFWLYRIVDGIGGAR